MKKIFTILLLILCVSSQITAQKVNGYLTDKATGKPLEGISVEIICEKDTQSHKSTVTDKSGYYEINDIIAAVTNYQEEKEGVTLSYNSGKLEVYITSSKPVVTGKLYASNGSILALTKLVMVETNSYYGTFDITPIQTGILIFSDEVNPAYKFSLNNNFISEKQASVEQPITLRSTSISNSETFIYKVNDTKKIYEGKTFKKTLDLDNPNQVDIELEKPEIDNLVRGSAQLGPFINGSTVRISELASNLYQTGRSFTLDIEDNSGTYELDTTILNSNYIRLDANGYYFNPVSGSTSNSAITLKGLSDIISKNKCNINVLTHLEKNRVEYLVKQGVGFSIAKNQAQKEVIKIFSIDSIINKDSELLNITKYGDDNAKLLAISIIIQGIRSEGELSELLSNISTDMKLDGELNDTSISSQLMQQVQYLDLEEIRDNLEGRITELGLNDTIPDFEKYITQFINRSGYGYESLFTYPATSNYGTNILHESITECKVNKQYSLAADIPESLDLKIVIKGGLWYYEVSSEGPLNWQVSKYSNRTQTFTSKQSGLRSDLKIEFAEKDLKGNTIEYITIEYYENLSDTPTKTKKIYLTK